MLSGPPALRRLAAPALALTACFNPPTQSDATGEPPASTTADPPATATDAPATSSGETAAPVTAADPGTTAPTDPSTTGPEPTTADATTSDLCDVACAGPTPYCLKDGTCGACVDLEADGSSCAAVVPTAPTCHPQTGSCFRCTSDAECAEIPAGQFCEEETGACGPCREHSDCPTTACDILGGVCFPDDPLMTRHTYVGTDCADVGCNSPVTPCCEVAEALAVSLAGTHPYHVIHVAAGEYTAPIELRASGETVAILGEPGFELVVNALEASPAILLGDYDQAPIGTSKLYVTNVEIGGGTTSSAVQVWHSYGMVLDDAFIYAQANGPALVVTEGVLRVRRSRLVNNRGAAYASTGGHIVLINTQISGTMMQAPALAALDNGRFDLVYTTIADSLQDPGAILACDMNTVVQIRNSALLQTSAPNSLDCEGTLAVVHSAVTSMPLYALDPDTNALVMESEVGDLFKQLGSGDLDLAGDGGPLKDVAEFVLTNPIDDIHRVRRVAIPGEPDVAGADLPGPP